MDSSKSPIPGWLAGALLGLAAFAVFWPATKCDFTNFDDPDYVTGNVHVQQPFTLNSLKSAFTHIVSGNWHPVTMLSHTLDYQLYGLNPWGHHLTSVLLHSLNTILVFVLLRQMTGALWRSLLVAALFAVHPLRAESVAWISERKDVLSGCFGLLTLIFYAIYVRKTEEGRQKPAAQRPWPVVGGRSPRFHLPSSIFYLLSLSCFALGLMSKPMLVTWPFVMLLLDYWPLSRFPSSVFRSPLSALRSPLLWRLVVEKIPFFALALVSSVVTFVVQQREGAVTLAAGLPFTQRGENVLVSYCRYLGKMLWPSDLAVLYPYPKSYALTGVVGAGIVLTGITWLCWQSRHRRPYLLMGWLWYGGTLVPVIGLVQVGFQAMADRYTYLPSLGFWILVVWGLAELVSRYRCLLVPLVLAAGLALAAFSTLARRQIDYWQDGETLFRHAVAVTQGNYHAFNNLGLALMGKGSVNAAISAFEEAVRLDQWDAEGHNNLGLALQTKGRVDAAISEFEAAAQLQAGNAKYHYNLGAALDQNGLIGEAVREYQAALRLNPQMLSLHVILGNGLAKLGLYDEAVPHLQTALEIKPDNADLHNDLGNALDGKGQTDEAIREYQEAIRLQPTNAPAHSNLGAAFGKKGELDKAITELREAARLKGDDPLTFYNLGMALYQKGQTNDAISQLSQALLLKPEFDAARKAVNQIQTP
jgi:Flp pilus assembly protein TadD